MNHATRIRILKSYGRLTLIDIDNGAVAATLYSSSGTDWTNAGDNIEECVRHLYGRINYAMTYTMTRVV